MDINQLLKNSGALEKLARQYGLNSTQVEEVVSRAVPEITKRIQTNTTTDGGLDSFLKALQDHKDDPVEAMLEDPAVVDTDDGDKILSHIFGDRKEPITTELSEVQGLSAPSVSGIIKHLAPILMGLLARQASKPTERDGGLLDGILGKNSSMTSMGKSFLDKDKDGKILDDVLGSIFKK